MKNTIILVALSFLTLSSFSQNFEWVKSLGGNQYDYGKSITIDATGNVYTTGTYQGTVDFDPGVGIYTLTSSGSDDAFVSKLDANGNFIWAKSMGGAAANEDADAIAVDASGNVYTTGWFRGPADFDPGIGTYTLGANGAYDVFVSKLDVNGDFVWAKGITSNNAQALGFSINVDGSGNVYISGNFTQTSDFDPGVGTYTLTATNTDYDSFIFKLNATGDFVWAKSMGGGGTDGTYSVLDIQGNIYMTGWFTGTSDFDPGSGTYTLSAASLNDVFVSKLDANGDFVWAKNMGGMGYDYARSIAIDASGNIYTTGGFGKVSATADFDPSSSIYSLTSNGDFDIFISKLDGNGNFVWAKSIGGTGTDIGASVSLDLSGNIYVTGNYNGTVDFDPGIGTHTLTSMGNTDAYILKLDPLGNFKWVKQIGGTSDDASSSITLDPTGNIYTTGSYSNIVDFGSGTSTSILTSAGGYDSFVLKLSPSPVGIEENSSSTSSINIYPNPNNGHFTVKSDKKEMGLDLINALGQVIQTLQLNHSNNYQLDINTVSSGVYFIIGQNEYHSLKQKIIVAN